MTYGESLDRYRPGSTEPWTVDVLCALIRALRPRILIETGTFEGLTTQAMYETLIRGGWGAKLHTVESDPARFRLMSESMTRWPAYGRLAVELVGAEAIQYLRTVADGTVDFVFLDDDHTAEHVAEEIQECLRVVRPGGVICGHDVIGPFGLDNVFKHFGGIALPFERLHAGGGLGIIVR